MAPQTDSIILSGGIDRFLDCDYIGAPWHRENDRWADISKNSPEGVGNGGFSLRDVQASLDISVRKGDTSSDDEQEDMFFAHFMTESTQNVTDAPRQYHIAPRTEAYQFCLEVQCSDLPLPELPMALHAGWYYNSVDLVQSYLLSSLENMLTGQGGACCPMVQTCSGDT
eukprot:365738-Chlamydomonas_euryale.AAC.9